MLVRRQLNLFLVVALAVGLTACGQGMKSSQNGSSSSLSSPVNNELPQIEFEKIEADTLAAEAALVEAEAAINESVGPRLQLSSSSSQVISEKSLTGVPEKLREALNKVYAKLTIPVAKAKEAVEKGRAKLVEQMAKLDPKNPLHIPLIIKITELMAKLDALEGRFGGVYDILASKVDLVVDKLDGLIAKIDLKNPLLWIPLMELQEIKSVVVEFKEKLANT